MNTKRGVISLGVLAIISLVALIFDLPLAQAHGKHITNRLVPVIKFSPGFTFDMHMVASVPPEALSTSEAYRQTRITGQFSWGKIEGDGWTFDQFNQAVFSMTDIRDGYRSFFVYESVPSPVIASYPSGSGGCPLSRQSWDDWPGGWGGHCTTLEDAIRSARLFYLKAWTSWYPDMANWFITFHLLHLQEIPENQPPTVGNDSYSVDEGDTLTGSAPGVLGNDTDPEGQALTAVLASGPAHGMLSLNPDGSFTYIPTLGFFGTDSFTYQANDGSLTSDIATVTITVVPLPAPTVELFFTRDETEITEAQMGKTYALCARVTNNSASKPIGVCLRWDENYTFPQFPAMHEQEQQDLLVVYLGPGETKEETLGTFAHSWDWIPRKNLFAFAWETGKNLWDTLKQAVAELLAGRLPLSDFVGSFFGPLTDLVELIMDTMTAVADWKPTTEIFYPTRVTYGRAEEPLDQWRSGPFLNPHLTLRVSLYKIAALSSALLNGGLAGLYTGEAILSLSTWPSESVAFLAAEVSFLGLSQLSYVVAADPADASFTEIPVPVPLYIPELDAVPEGFSKEIAKAALELYALKKAEVTALNRAIAAASTRRPEWESAQLAAAGRYALDAATRYARILGLQKLQEPFIAHSLALRAQEIPEFVQAHGLPELEVYYLTQLGWSPEELEGLRQTLIREGTRPFEEPGVAFDALKTGAELSEYAAADALARAFDIRVNQLGAVVRDLTVEEQTSLNATRDTIYAGLAKKIPSRTLLATIEGFLDDINLLIEQTNNLAALQPYLDFGLQALTEFQGLEVSLEGLRRLVDARAASGGITHKGIATSLRDKLTDAQEELAEGDFEDIGGILGAFLNEVRAQRGKKITDAAADDLTAYASYLLEFFPQERDDDDEEEDEDEDKE